MTNITTTHWFYGKKVIPFWCFKRSVVRQFFFIVFSIRSSNRRKQLCYNHVDVLFYVCLLHLSLQLLVKVSHHWEKLTTTKHFLASLSLTEQCDDLTADPESCTKFIRCISDIRIRFTCPPGTAWENSLKTCVYTEQVEGCQRVQQKRVIGNFILCMRLFLRIFILKHILNRYN